MRGHGPPNCRLCAALWAFTPPLTITEASVPPPPNGTLCDQTGPSCHYYGIMIGMQAVRAGGRVLHQGVTNRLTCRTPGLLYKSLVYSGTYW